MTLVSTLPIPIRVVGGHARAELDIRVTAQPFPTQALLDIEVDGSLSEAARPVSGEQIVAPLRVFIGGVELPPWQRLPGATFSESIDGTLTFSFAVPTREDGDQPWREPLGHPASWLGVPGGKKEVRVDAELLTPTGRKSVRLMTSGMLDNTSSDALAGVRHFVATGQRTRYDRQLVTLQFPPGHGQQSGTVARRLLTEAGVPAESIAISGGDRRYRELSVIDGEAFAAANALLEPELRRVQDARDGSFRLLDFAWDTERRREYVFRAEDLLAGIGSLGDSATSDTPTAVTLTGVAQVTRDECGLRTEYQVIDSFGVREIRGARYTHQALTGTVSPVGGVWEGAPAELRRIERRVIVREFACDTLLAEETVAWGWYSPEAARYELATDGTIGDYFGGYLYDDGAVADDSTPLYVWRTERWVPVTWDRVEHSYDERGYLTTSTTRSGRWTINPAPTKNRTVVTSTWESEDFEVVPITAGGVAVLPAVGGHVAEGWDGPSGVYDEVESFGWPSPIKTLRKVEVQHVPYHLSHVSFSGAWDDDPNTVSRMAEAERRVQSSTVTDDGFITREETAVYRWGLVAGVAHNLYSDGTESVDFSPSWRVMERETVTYAATGEAGHDEFYSRFDVRGAQVEGQASTGLAGYLPAATKRQEIEPDPTIYDDPDEAEHARPASRNESQPIKVTISSPGLEAVRETWTDKGAVEQAETVEQLTRVATQRLREAAAPRLSWPLAFNPLARVATEVAFDVPAIGWVYDRVMVEAVELVEPSEGEAGYTQCSGRAILL